MTAFDWFQILADLFFLFLILLLLASRAWKRGAGNEAEHESYREMIATLSDLIREMKEASQGLEERIAEKQAEVTGAVAAADARIERLKDLLSETGKPGPTQTSVSPQTVTLANRNSPGPTTTSGATQTLAATGTLPVANRNSPEPVPPAFAPPSRVPDLERRIRSDEHLGDLPYQAAAEPVAEAPLKPVKAGKRRASTDHGSATAFAAPDEPGASEARHAQPGRPSVAMVAPGEDEDERREKYRQALDYARKGWDVLDIARFTGLPRGEVDLLVRTKGKKV